MKCIYEQNGYFPEFKGSTEDEFLVFIIGLLNNY